MFKSLRIIVLNLSLLILLNRLVNAGEEREVRQIYPFEGKVSFIRILLFIPCTCDNTLLVFLSAGYQYVERPSRSPHLHTLKSLLIRLKVSKLIGILG